jgi:hypothetical protein
MESKSCAANNLSQVAKPKLTQDYALNCVRKFEKVTCTYDYYYDAQTDAITLAKR